MVLLYKFIEFIRCFLIYIFIIILNYFDFEIRKESKKREEELWEMEKQIEVKKCYIKRKFPNTNIDKKQKKNYDKEHQFATEILLKIRKKIIVIKL